MSNFHYPTQHYQNNLSHASHPHSHHGRSRRGPRISSAQNAHRQHFAKAQRSPKESVETRSINAYIKDLEAARGFDFEDDEIFCPFHLLTEDDVRLNLALSNKRLYTDTSCQLHSIHSSSSSDRSSLSSGSPEASPMQQQVQPTPSFLLSSPQNYNQTAYHQNNAAQQHQMKLHQPMAQRTRNAIPIVDPTTRAVASPEPSVSPARQMQNQYGRRW